MGFKIDLELSFNKHVGDLCKEANRKLRVLAEPRFIRISKKENLQWTLSSTPSLIIVVSFGCYICYIVVIAITKCSERCLRLIYNDKSSYYEELPENDKSVSKQHRNLESIATEIRKVKNDLSPEIVSELFLRIREIQCSLRVNHTNYDFSLAPVKTVHHGTESIYFQRNEVFH